MKAWLARAADSDVWWSFKSSSLTVVAAVSTLLIIAIAFLSPLLAPHTPFDPATLSLSDGLKPPVFWSADGDWTYPLGTDDQGRDVLSSIMYGTRLSLLVGFASVVVAMVLGITLGLLSGYLGGMVDSVIMRVADVQLTFPAILVAMMLLAALGQGVDKVILALVLVQWAYFARAVRGTALVERRREYIEAAQCLALPTHRIIFRHLLPNCLPPLIVVGTMQVARAIALEATLSFLGLGVPITEPSLGLLIANGYEYMLSGKYWISFYPGIALLVTIVSINLVGDQLRDVLNPRLKK